MVAARRQYRTQDRPLYILDDTPPFSFPLLDSSAGQVLDLIYRYPVRCPCALVKSQSNSLLSLTSVT